MNDLGFGMLEKRSVAAILFSLGLAVALGFQFPINTANVEGLFIGIVIFTGALYLCRSLFRIFIATLFFIFEKDIRFGADPSFGRESMPSWIRNRSNKLSFSSLSWYVFDSDYTSKTKDFVRFLDRAVLVSVVLLACQPTLKPYVDISGIVGIIVMLIIYLLRGSFTFTVRDSVDATAEYDENRSEDMAKQRKYKEDIEEIRRNRW